MVELGNLMVDYVMQHRFDTREQASIAVADHIKDLLVQKLQHQKDCSLVVTGGSSPVDCYRYLSSASIDWSRINIVLSDERWVSPDSSDSNENLVRKHLLQGPAGRANLLPVFQPNADIKEACSLLGERIHGLSTPFACALLGMGEDGHFASLFSDAGNLATGLDIHGDTLCLPVETASSPYPRVSLTMAALLMSDEIILLIFGADKKALVDNARQSPDLYPVSHLLSQHKAPVRVYWAP